MKRTSSAVFAACLMAASVGQSVYGADHSSNKGQPGVEREVRHELLTLSRYGVFDNIAYRVNGTEVTLTGQVVQPVLKDDAGSAVKGIEGVTTVDNRIEVLPLSPMDDRIRRAVFRAIYSDPGLSRYSFQAIPSIHIVVKNGSVTLEGAVANQMDREVAGLRANAVPGLFGVTNHLRVDAGGL